jgi:alanine dehydrogenase
VNPAPPIYLAESDLADLLDWRATTDLLEEAFRDMSRGEAVNRPRLRIPMAQSTYNVMAAGWPNRDVAGLKVYTVSSRGAPTHILLHASDGSGLLAVMEAGALSGYRTGGVSGLSAKYMARKGDGPIGVIGTGYQAAAQVKGILAATGAKTVNVYSRDAEKCIAFAERMSSEINDAEVTPRASGAAVCVDARIVVTITNSQEPVLAAEDIAPGTHVIAAGNNTWMHAEIDPRLFERATTVVVDDLDQARLESGELMRAADQGLLSWTRVHTLADVVAGLVPGRTSDDEITIFESQGIALADLAVAAHLYHAAHDLGRGVPLA